eukprot:TRINITY_DN122_c0_g1_i1.p1 TRINITY_DN122_c0_g1~~TRINITY_DN122_c0_g1_i1.p1  ORF type:complete len:218 (-),score=49.58 TRINITY_DN122_c0_g1_i1:71-724(-)
MTLYYNPISNSARIAHWFTVASNIDVSVSVINFATGDHKKPEYLQLNPAGQVPTYKDDDVVVYESSAIIRFLAAKHKSDLYPINDPARLGVIDSAYEHIRQKPWETVSSLVFQTYIAPGLYNTPPDEEKVNATLEKADQQLQFINDNFFKTSPDFVVGNSLSIADIALGTTVFHGTLAKPAYNVDKFPKVAAWWKAIQETDHFKTAHKPVFEALQNQ